MSTTLSTTFPPAELDRRFYAFVLDRLVAWVAYAAAGWASYVLLIEPGRTGAGIAAIAGAVVLVWLAFAVLLGAQGTSPGKAVVGLRVVDHESGSPIGLGPALLRSLVLGLAVLPTFGLGAASLAWTAVMDRDRQRRGWHDHLTRAVVVDVRPLPVDEAEEDPAPRQVVNLTAMRLVPAPVVPVATPSRAPATPPATPAPMEDQRTAPRVTPRPAAPTPSPPRWRLTFDTGEAVTVEGLVLVGRRPEARGGEQVGHLVALRSEDMSLSKTHAQLAVAPDGALVVMDRGSTNGSVLVRQGVARPLTGGTAATLLAGDQVRFGDRQMTVSRESAEREGR